MPPADNTPDFDNMSPEEIMAWMESLAKRQGADASGFMTAADMAVPDIDPDSVVIDEPGYIPYGKDPAKWVEEEAARKQAEAERRAAAPPTPPAAPPPPPQPQLPAMELLNTDEEETHPLTPETPALQSSMSWLESLAADQGADFSELDLSGLVGEAEAAQPEAPTRAANPLQWLENLAGSDGEVTEPLETAAQAPTSDQLNWLESLAREQGGDSEEFITSADLDIAAPAEQESGGPGYTPYSFEAPPPSAEKAPRVTIPPVPSESHQDMDDAELEDPAAWLDSLATSQGFQDEAESPAPVSATSMTDDAIQAALLRGDNIPPEQMEAWMKRQLIAGAQRPDPEPEYDPEAPAVPAEIPDWLIDQVGQQAEASPTAEASQPPLIEEITEPPAVADMPDWLREKAPLENDLELENIFAETEDETPPAPETVPAPEPVAAIPLVSFTPVDEPELDVSDPWVEAFDAEHEMDNEAIPDWYERNINDQSRKDAVERLAQTGQLEDPDLPEETELPAGEPDAVPDWLGSVLEDEDAIVEPGEIPDWLSQEVIIEQPTVTALQGEVTFDDEMPDWLREADVEASEVPNWLTETLDEAAAVVAEAPPAPAPKPAAAPVIPPAAPAPRPAVSPAPVPAQASDIDVAAVLASARQKIGANDVSGGLVEYEHLIRANVELDAVVADLSKAITQHKNNAALYRVLGDGLMRQGQLQAALDTYRKALNQL